MMETASGARFSRAKVIKGFDFGPEKSLKINYLGILRKRVLFAGEV